MFCAKSLIVKVKVAKTTLKTLLLGKIAFHVKNFYKVIGKLMFSQLSTYFTVSKQSNRLSLTANLLNQSR